MSGNNKIWILWMAGWIFTACQVNSYVPDAYSFKASEIMKNPYGCWTIMEIKANEKMVQPETVSGELLFMDEDTLFLLVTDRIVRPIVAESILTAELYTHRNMGENYLSTTALFLIPNVLGSLIYTSEFGGGFLAIGIPVAAMGLLHSIIEGSSKRNMLQYPKNNSLEDLSQFSRFPAGRPMNIDLHQLKLKPSAASR